MAKFAHIGLAAAGALIAASLGGSAGFLIARILVEHIGLAEGPPAGVLLVLLVAILSLLGGVIGFVSRSAGLARSGQTRHETSLAKSSIQSGGQ